MAWVSVRQAVKLTGKARSSLYRDMATGRVSYRSEADGGRSLETSELIRAYGALRQDETTAWDTGRQGNETGVPVMEALVSEIKALREEVAGLKSEMQAVRQLEHKPGPAARTPGKWWRFWDK